MKLSRCLWLILGLLMLLTACTPPAAQGTDTTTPVAGEVTTHDRETDEATVGGETESEADTEAVTDPETEAETNGEQEGGVPVEPLYIEERYFIFRVWNFSILTESQFKTIVDKVVQDGFNAIKVHIPWHHVERTAGVYDYSAFDPLVSYVLEKGLKVAISLDLTRRSGDAVLGEDDIMRDADGNLCKGGSLTGDRLQISLNSENAVDKAVAFYRDAVAHYESLCGDAVLFYLPAFSQYAETEYWCTDEYDYSDHAKTAFRAFLKESYGTVAELNRVLGTNYLSFDGVEPPSATQGDSLGQLWYIFRHQSLKNAIDRLAAAQEAVAPNSKFSIQLGCVYDTASVLRCTLGVAELCENVDVLWIDDGPLMNHKFSMDYVRSILPATVELAQEIDGPKQNGATPERYLDQGLTCFARGCTYVSAANWEMDASYESYRPVWQEIAGTWLGETPPAVVQPDKDTPTVEVSLLALFRRRTPDAYVSAYTKAAGADDRFVYVKVVDDLTSSIPKDPVSLYAFPGDFSGEQGSKNWYYRTCTRGKMTDMTFDAANNRWQGSAEFALIMNGTMHPDTVDTALVFKAPKAGEMECTLSFAVASEQSDGVILYILHNGEEVAIGDARFGGVAVKHGEAYDGTVVLTVAEGDEIAFVINRNGTNAHDSTGASVQVIIR